MPLIHLLNKVHPTYQYFSLFQTIFDKIHSDGQMMDIQLELFREKELRKKFLIVKINQKNLKFTQHAIFLLDTILMKHFGIKLSKKEENLHYF